MDTKLEDYILFRHPFAYQVTQEHEPCSNNSDNPTAVSSNPLNLSQKEQDIYDASIIIEEKCLGKNCKRLGINRLRIAYVNKAGLFCDSCTEDLLREGLASRVDDI